MIADLVRGLLDDASTFPPGNLPLRQAVPAHAEHLRSAHAELVGPLVLAAKDLETFAAALPAGESMGVTLTVSRPALAEALKTAKTLPGVRLEAVEVTLPPGDAAAGLDPAPAVTTYIEVPRDERRDAVLAALTGTAYRAKFRTGGVREDLYPDEAELAGSVAAAVRAEVPFKATAGLHHAVRNTDPETGFEQHGFLNLMLATAAAQDGAALAELAALLAERDGARVAALVFALSPSVRTAFRSFGTCSVAEPVQELVSLGLLR